MERGEATPDSRLVWKADAVIQARDYVVGDSVLATLSRPLRGKDYVYENPWPSWEAIGFTDFVKNLFRGEKVSAKVPSKDLLDQELPILAPDWVKLKQPNSQDLQITWIGHSTFLVQMDGLTFLTDPVFAERCSPVSWAGPKRFRKTPMKLTELPPVDFVLISHSHYDHLDISVVAALGDQTCWFVPEGLKKWFAAHGVLNVVELDWWQRATVQGRCEVTCLPTQHWSNRGLTDKNETLWGSFGVKSLISGRTAYFGGDTGYCSVFKEIGEHVGPFDLALIPIGAYHPRELFKYAHVDPAEIHKDIKSKFSIGCHFGTFVLTAENCLEPKFKLAQEVAAAELPSNSFITINIGETYVVDNSEKKYESESKSEETSIEKKAEVKSLA